MEPEDSTVDHALFTSTELTRIYREEAAEAAASGRRLTVLLAPYGGPRIPPTGRES